MPHGHLFVRVLSLVLGVVRGHIFDTVLGIVRGLVLVLVLLVGSCSWCWCFRGSSW